MSATPTTREIRLMSTAAAETKLQEKKDESLDALFDAFSQLMLRFQDGELPLDAAGPLTELLVQMDVQQLQQTLSANGHVAPNVALQALLRSDELSSGQKNLLQRVLIPSHPQAIEVDNNGTPSEVGRLQGEVSTLTSDKTSLQQQLDNRPAAAPTADNVVPKAAVKAEAEKVKAALDEASGWMGRKSLTTEQLEEATEATDKLLELATSGS